MFVLLGFMHSTMYTVNHDVLESVALFVSHGSRMSYLDGYFSDFAWAVSSSKAFSSETKDDSVSGSKGIAVKVAWCRTGQEDG